MNLREFVFRIPGGRGPPSVIHAVCAAVLLCCAAVHSVGRKRSQCIAMPFATNGHGSKLNHQDMDRKCWSMFPLTRASHLGYLFLTTTAKWPWASQNPNRFAPSEDPGGAPGLPTWDRSHWFGQPRAKWIPCLFFCGCVVLFAVGFMLVFWKALKGMGKLPHRTLVLLVVEKDKVLLWLRFALLGFHHGSFEPATKRHFLAEESRSFRLLR